MRKIQFEVLKKQEKLKKRKIIKSKSKNMFSVKKAIQAKIRESRKPKEYPIFSEGFKIAENGFFVKGSNRAPEKTDNRMSTEASAMATRASVRSLQSGKR